MTNNRKFDEIDARMAAIEANLMVHDSLLIEIHKWLSQTPDGEAFVEAMSFQLEAEAARFASMPEDRAGRFPAISEALLGMATALSQSPASTPEPTPTLPNLRLVKSE
ncbi:MAG: hypothetical protein AAFQ55_06830 [Pseudomonadota bacterium]